MYKKTTALLLCFIASHFFAGCSQARLADWDDDNMENATNDEENITEEEIRQLCREVLEVNQNTSKAIRTAYKTISRKYHPDRNRHACEIAREIQQGVNDSHKILMGEKKLENLDKTKEMLQKTIRLKKTLNKMRSKEEKAD